MDKAVYCLDGGELLKNPEEGQEDRGQTKIVRLDMVEAGKDSEAAPEDKIARLLHHRGSVSSLYYHKQSLSEAVREGEQLTNFKDRELEKRLYTGCDDHVMALWRLELISSSMERIHLPQVRGREYRTVHAMEIVWPLIDFCVLFCQMMVFPFEGNMPWSDAAEPVQVTLPVFSLEFELTYDMFLVQFWCSVAAALWTILHVCCNSFELISEMYYR